MKLLAIDTATEQCSVALLIDGTCLTSVVPTARSHAELILPMIDELLQQATLKLSDLDGIAFGRGPGSFTGVRIAVSVAQGLSLSSGLPVVAVSNLQAVAQQAITEMSLAIDATILVCMDARMQEVYWALFRVNEHGQVQLCGAEHVSSPSAVKQVLSDSHDTHEALVTLNCGVSCGVGTGWDAYPQLKEQFPSLTIGSTRLPRAQEVAWLALPELRAGLGVSAAQAQPVYLRDNVTHASK